MTCSHEKALQRIIQLCRKSSKPTFRLCRVYDIALEGFGLSQIERIAEIKKHLSSEDVDMYLEKQETARKRALEKQQRRIDKYDPQIKENDELAK